MAMSSGDRADVVVRRLFRASLEVTGALSLAGDQVAGPLREVIERLDESIRLVQGQALDLGPKRATRIRVPCCCRPRHGRLVGRVGISRGQPAAAGQIVGRRAAAN